MLHKYPALCAMLLFAVHLGADELVFNSDAAWADWQRPFGLTEIGNEGQLRLVKFRKDINAVEDAHLFSHETREHGDAVFGGIWEAGSNPEDALLAIDGDPKTFWQPDPDSAPEDWFITIDLGRAVLAREIRLTFPDQEGARPLRQFTVLVNTGVRINATRDIFLFRSAYRTTRPNHATSIAIPLGFSANDSTLVVDAGLRVAPDRRDRYQLVQYVNITAEEQSADGALAEVEVIGIGETGLDYFYDHSPREAQRASFRVHAAAARETGLPLIVHARAADDEMIAILRDETAKGAFPGVLHCFSSGPALARAALEIGFYISFSGILTFKKADEVREVAAEVPLDRLLVETDAPYLAPVPHRGKDNEPSFVAHTAAKLAEMRGLGNQEIAALTTANFRRLFNKTT